MKINIKENKIKDKRGITIIETIISIYLVSMGMLGLMSLMVQTLQAKKINTDTVVASMLAQEGLELVRNIRDTNWLIVGNDWKLGIGAGSTSDIVQDSTYAIDFNPAGTIRIYSLVDDISDIGAILYRDSNNYFVHDSGGSNTQTPFSRIIIIQDNGENVSVECKVRWSVKNSYNEYVATTYLYNWR